MSLRVVQIVHEHRREVILSVALLAVLAVTSLPTFLFFLWKPESSYRKAEINCDVNHESVSWNRLQASLCSEYFDWNIATESTRNISALKCTFGETDENLNKINDILSLLGSSNQAEDCLTYAKPILCHYIFKDCEVQGNIPTKQDCEEVRDVYCKGLWEMAANVLQGSDTLGQCIEVPDCSKGYIDSPQSVLFTEGNPVPVEPQEQNKSEVLCTPPLVKTELQDIPYYLRCSPKCFQEDWISDRDQTAMEVMIIPLLIGRRNAYCSHEDVLSMFADPSIIY